MQAVQRIEREKRMDGGKKEEADDPHTSAAKQKRPLRIGARAEAGTALARVTGVSPLRGSLEAAYRSIIVS